MTDALASARPVLHLSGAKLRAALEQLIAAAESVGGIERLVAAVKLRGDVFRDRVGDGRMLTRAAFDDVLPLMPTVRRRIGPVIEAHGWPSVQNAVADLLHNAHVPGSADHRIAAFEDTLRLRLGPLHSPLRGGAGGGGGSPSGDASSAPLSGGDEQRNVRCLRDLAAELLHATHPEHYPLMARWVWDAKTNTGVLREIWHDPDAGDDVDHVVIPADDQHETFLVLREELSQFLADNGIFRDMLWYVDALQAQVYAIYINAQGGAYLKGDFQAIGDPLEHTKRILGLDRIHGRRKGTVDGEAYDSDSMKRLV